MSDCKILRQNTFQGPGGKVSPLWQMVAGQGWEKKHVFFVLFVFFPSTKNKTKQKHVFFPQQKKDAFFKPNPVAGEAKLPKKNGLQSQNPQKTAKKTLFWRGSSPRTKTLRFVQKKYCAVWRTGKKCLGIKKRSRPVVILPRCPFPPSRKSSVRTAVVTVVFVVSVLHATLGACSDWDDVKAKEGPALLRRSMG